MYLQVGAFASRDNALRLRSRLAGIADTGVKVSETSKDERPVYRVRIGPLAGVDQADQLVASLARIGIEDPRVVVE
jgi:rare lipoprotein A